MKNIVGYPSTTGSLSTNSLPSANGKEENPTNLPMFTVYRKIISRYFTLQIFSGHFQTCQLRKYEILLSRELILPRNGRMAAEAISAWELG